MTYLSILRPLPETAVSRPLAAGGRRAVLYLAVFAAATAGVLLGQSFAQGADIRGQGADIRGMEPSLVSLLRFMAVLKAAGALAMLGLTHWRLTRPAGTGVAVAYGAAVALAAASPGLIWSLSAVAPGAVLFHAGLILFMILAWCDDTVELKLRS